MDYPKSVPGVGLVGGKFVDENTALGQQGSLIPAEWGNSVTEEILNVIKSVGVDPSEGDSFQLLKAIRSIVYLFSEKSYAMAETYTEVPADFKAWMIAVSEPHLRVMTWDHARKKYVRAPFHRPGVLFHSSAPAASIRHGIQVRGDVVYKSSDHPDLAELFGYMGDTFVMQEGRARVLRGADNGVGIDSTLLDGSLQGDAIRNITASVRAGYDWGMISNTGFVSGAFKAAGDFPNYISTGSTGAVSKELVFDASSVVPTANENRVKSLVATLYITR